MKTIQIKEITQEFGNEVVVKNRVCVVCKEGFNYNGWYKNRGRHQGQVDNNCCENCQFWADNLATDLTTNDWAIINRHHYRFGGHLQDYKVNPKDTLDDIAKSFNSNSKVKGMGGAKSIIIINKDRAVITDDLWSQGDITEPFTNPLDDLDVPSFIRKNPMTNNAQFHGAK